MKGATAETLIYYLLRHIGEDINREGLLRTPERVVKSWEKIYGGYKVDPAKILATSFEGDGYDQIVLLKDVEFYSTCEHHILPFFGVAHIAYIPDERVVGISKLARLLECYSRRLQIQERLCQDVVDAMVTHLKPHAAACILKAVHFCMTSRGVEKQKSAMVTSALYGSFDNPEARAELMSLIHTV